MSGTMAGGSTPEEAAQMLAIFSEIKPQWEETYARAAQAAIKKLVMEGRGKQFGIAEDASPYQQMQQLSRNLGGRNLAKKDLDIAIKGITDQVEAGVAIEGLVRRGKAGSFERIAGYQSEKETPNDYIQTTIKDWEGSDEGKAADAEARLAQARIERGSRGQALMAAKGEAEIGIISSGELEKPEGYLESLATKAGEAAGQGDRREQLIRAEANRMLLARLSGSKEGREWLSKNVEGEETNNPAFSSRRALMENAPRGASEDLLAQAANEVQRIRNLIQKQLDAAEAAKKPAMNAPPPNTPGRVNGS